VDVTVSAGSGFATAAGTADGAATEPPSHEDTTDAALPPATEVPPLTVAVPYDDDVGDGDTGVWLDSCGVDERGADTLGRQPSWRVRNARNAARSSLTGTVLVCHDANGFAAPHGCTHMATTTPSDHVSLSGLGMYGAV
jgi:hypothetical protein